MQRPDVEKMLSSISSRQFSLWRAYSDMEPWDEQRDDLRAADIVREIRDLRRSRGRPPAKIEECMLRFGEQRDRSGASANETRGALSMLVALARASKAKREKKRGKSTQRRILNQRGE